MAVVRTGSFSPLPPMRPDRGQMLTSEALRQARGRTLQKLSLQRAEEPAWTAL